MASAYSYLRFSSPEQAKGDTIRRQTESSAAWCARNKIALDTSITLRDEGVSAFKGKHRAAENADTHALAGFLAAVKAGRVQAGSYLILESLDRLTREDIIPAVNLFTGILMAGVKIVQLHPTEHVYTMGADMTAVMLALVELSRGNSESRMKSERVGAAWSRKQSEAAAKIVTRRTPGWINSDGGKLTLDPAKAKIVGRIFALAIDGHGARAIAQTLNAEGVPVFGRTVCKGRPVAWGTSAVFQVLTSRAVVGEYIPYRKRAVRGEPVPGYFPSAVDDATFYAAQAAMKTRAGVGRGRRGKHVNLFAGMLSDARDGGTLSYRHANGRSALIPITSLSTGHGKWVSFPAHTFEAAVLSKLIEVKASDITGGADANKKLDALSGRLAEIDALVKAWEAKMDDIAIVNAVAAKLAALGAEKKRVAEEHAEALREASSPIGAAWKDVTTLAGMLAKDDGDDLRLKVRGALRRAIESVACLFMASPAAKFTRLAAVRVQFKSGTHRDYLITARAQNAAANRSATWAVASFADAGLPSLDLRKPEHAARLEKAITNALAKAVAPRN